MGPQLGLKAMKACMRYAELHTRIKEIGREIGNAYPCIDLKLDDEVDDGLPLYLIPSTTCLDRYFSFHRGRRIYGDVAPTLCHVCQLKYELIQERKTLRQRLGAAKRFVVKVGKETAGDHRD